MKSSTLILVSLISLSFFSSCKSFLSSPTVPEVKGSWTALTPGISVDSIISTSTGLIAFSNTPGQPAFYSSNNGTSWSALVLAQDNHPYWVMADISNNARVMVYSVHDSTLYLSINGGQSWVPLNHTADSTIRAVSWFSGNRLFAQIFRYPPADPTIPTDSILSDTVYSAAKYFVLKSDDFGNTWDTVFRYSFSELTLNSAQLLALRSIRGSLYAFTGTQIYKSTNNGSTWASINSVVPTGGQYMGTLANGNVIGYGNNNFYQSPDSCHTWVQALSISLGQKGSMAFDSCVMVLSYYGGVNLICGSPTTGKWLGADAGIPATVLQGSPTLTVDNQFVYLTLSPNIYRRPRTDFLGL